MPEAGGRRRPGPGCTTPANQLAVKMAEDLQGGLGVAQGAVRLGGLDFQAGGDGRQAIRSETVIAAGNIQRVDHSHQLEGCPGEKARLPESSDQRGRCGRPARLRRARPAPGRRCPEKGALAKLSIAQPVERAAPGEKGRPGLTRDW